MCNYCNTEYLHERLSAVCKERDELKRENAELKLICEKQAVMNGRVAVMAMELDDVKAERDFLYKLVDGMADKMTDF